MGLNINPKVKINEIRYRDVLLSQKLPPAEPQFYGELNFLRDTSPEIRAR